MVIISLEELEKLFSQRKLNDTNEKSNDGNQNVQDIEAIKLVELLRLLTNDENRKTSFCKLIVRSSESEKISIIINAIKTMASPLFHKIYLYTKNEDSRVARFLKTHFYDFVEIHQGLSHLDTINIDSYFRGHNLVIFNDLCNHKGFRVHDEGKMSELYTKSKFLKCSTLCFTEHPAHVNETIRSNTNADEYYKDRDKVLF